MNKENIAKLIKAIEFDGQAKFNMSSFVGKIVDSTFDKTKDYAYSKHVRVLHIEDLTTDLFNCNSVGCIAGFATAVANDWKNPFVNIENTGEHISYYFEKQANDFLGLTQNEGKNLYYGDDNSVWKFLLYTENPSFPELRLEDDLSFDYEDDWTSSEYNIDFLSIKPEYAIKLLQMLIDEEITLSNEYGEPTYINKLVKTNSGEE